MKIHPTAIVSPQAMLGEDVEVGAYAIIGDGVHLGAGTVVQAHAVIEGDTHLGERNKVGYGAVIGAPPQDFAFKPSLQSAVRIGNGNTFREYVTIHRGTKEGTTTVVGDDCYLMVGTHLAHNNKIGNKVIIANNCLLAGYVEIGDGAILGGGTVFHQFIRIGHMAMVRGGTRFGKDIPPYVTANGENIITGINVIGLRRAGLAAETRMELKRVFRAVFASKLNMSQALAEAEKESWGAEAKSFLEFVRASKRGLCHLKRAGEYAGGPED